MTEAAAAAAAAAAHLSGNLDWQTVQTTQICLHLCACVCVCADNRQLILVIICVLAEQQSERKRRGRVGEELWKNGMELARDRERKYSEGRGGKHAVCVNVLIGCLIQSQVAEWRRHRLSSSGSPLLWSYSVMPFWLLIWKCKEGDANAKEN